MAELAFDTHTARSKSREREQYMGRDFTHGMLGQRKTLYMTCL